MSRVTMYIPIALSPLRLTVRFIDYVLRVSRSVN